MKQIRSGKGSAGRFINDPALYNNANEIALQLRKIAEDLRAGRGTAGKLLTNDELYLASTAPPIVSTDQSSRSIP